MLHRSYMRRGVSLEVIVEEDDNAVVSLDAHPLEEDEEYYEEDSNLSSPSSISGRECIHESHRNKAKENKNEDDIYLNNFERLREEKEKRRKKKEEEERWRNLGRQRSLSCETLTILDVGDDEFSQEQWEEEARDWDMEENSNSLEIKQCISRREILESRIAAQNHCEYEDRNQECCEEGKIYEDNSYHNDGKEESWNSLRTVEYEKSLEQANNRGNPPNSDHDDNDCNCHNDETIVDEIGHNQELTIDNLIDSELQNGHEICYDKEEEIGEISAMDENKQISEESYNADYQDSLKRSDVWLQDSLGNQSDSWITVGELENGELENSEVENGDMENGDVENGELKDKMLNSYLEKQSPQTLNQEPTLPRVKEVRFSDKLEILIEEKDSTVCDAPKMANNPSSNILQDHLLSVKSGRDLFESKQLNRGKKALPIHPERLAAALENPQVMVVERPSSSPSSLSDLSTASSASLSASLESKSPLYNIHNMELHPEELPPPHTVASVRQLFETLPVPIHKMPSFLAPTRFDHVRSNPTSKILRFDRDRHDPELSSSTPSSNSLTLPRFRKESAPVSSRTPTRRATIALRPSEDFSSTGIYLRKPRVASGFNIQKALQENPRYFHIRVGEKSKSEVKVGTETRTKETSPKTRTITYSYLEAKHQQRSGATTSLRWTKETFDRSDAESMSSESSEDSGVSKDFSSTILSSFSSSSKKKKKSWPHPLSNEYASDPSFKWIDPQVLAKIRSVGTTVIYFGPRHRPAGRPSSRTLRHPLKWINEESNIMAEDPYAERLLQNSIMASSEMKDENLQNFYLKSKNEKGISSKTKGNGPRIVGVVHKKNGQPYYNGVNGTTNNYNHGCHGNNNLLHQDSRRCSISDNKQLRWQSPRDASVVYDFTQPHSTPSGFT